MRPGIVVLAGLVFALTACQSLDISGKQRYERHSMSNLKTDPTSTDGALIFEAKASPQYPIDSPGAEAVRMQWAEEWLASRSLCADGFEVVSKRKLTVEDYNPNRYALRYELVCLPPPDTGE